MHIETHICKACYHSLSLSLTQSDTKVHTRRPGPAQEQTSARVGWTRRKLGDASWLSLRCSSKEHVRYKISAHAGPQNPRSEKGLLSPLSQLAWSLSVPNFRRAATGRMGRPVPLSSHLPLRYCSCVKTVVKIPWWRLTISGDILIENFAIRYHTVNMMHIYAAFCYRVTLKCE